MCLTCRGASKQSTELEFSGPASSPPTRLARRKTNENIDAMILGCRSLCHTKTLQTLLFYLRRLSQPPHHPLIEEAAICPSQCLISAFKQIDCIARLTAGTAALANEYCSSMAAFGGWDAVLQDHYKHLRGRDRGRCEGVMQICGGMS